jgi:monoamine oxidase
MRCDQAGSREFRLPGGYRQLFEALARGLDILLNTPVVAIRHLAGRVDVGTPRGVVSGDRCIVTLPVGVLQAGMVAFDPPLSQRKQQAIAAFDVEPATKLIYRFGGRHWDDAMTYLCHTGLVARWWTPGFGRDDAANTVLVAYVTARRARRIDAMPEREALASGLRELAALLGVAGNERDCIAARRVAWGQDGYARGGYAAVPAGAAWAREALAAPEGDRLVFAGEACAYWSNPQTVHGAIESGLRAAQQCLKRPE